MNSLPNYDLELKAAEERRVLHSSVEELKTRVRETFEPAELVREHLWTGLGIAVFVAFVAGYGITGIFTRR